METLSDNWRAAAAIVATGATLLFLMRQLSRRRARKKREAKRRALADAQRAHPEFPAVDPGNGAPLLTGIRVLELATVVAGECEFARSSHRLYWRLARLLPLPLRSCISSSSPLSLSLSLSLSLQRGATDPILQPSYSHASAFMRPDPRRPRRRGRSRRASLGRHVAKLPQDPRA